MLGAVALAGLRPWATTSVVPDLSVSPGIGVAIGDSTVVARAEPSAHGTGGVAAFRSTAAVSAPEPVAVSTPRQRPSGPALAVSAGRAVQTSAPIPASPSPAPAPGPAPSPEPVAATPTPAPEQVPAPPLVATVDNGPPGASGRPGTAVVGGGEPEQSCEGGEYVITVTFEEAEDGEEEDYELAEAEILVKRLGADGGEDEVELRGDLTDVRNLVATLVAEGNCVQVHVVPPESAPAEGALDAGADAAEPGDVAGSILP